MSLKAALLFMGGMSIHAIAKQTFMSRISPWEASLVSIVAGTLGVGLGMFWFLGHLHQVLGAIRKQAAKNLRHRTELEQEITRLRQASSRTDPLSSLILACAWCKRVRGDDGRWDTLETYLTRNARRPMTHGICPDCAGRMRAED